jgi:hypothetical protein
MLSRSKILEDKLDVGPGQYSPTYNFGKEKSPAFRYSCLDLACAQNKIATAKINQDPDSMNTGRNWQ